MKYRLKQLYQIVAITVIIMMNNQVFSQPKEISVFSELVRFQNIGNLPEYVNGSTVKQFSSYDRKGGNNDGFEGTYSYLRKEADSSLVIFEAQGNGVINRIWTPTPTNDILDFYFGKTAKPSFSIRFSDLFSGKVYPFTDPLSGNELGGFYTYMPIPFKNGCKVVLRGKKLEFYQIQYRSYPKNYQVKNFTPDLSEAAKNVLKNLNQNWSALKDASKEVQIIHTDTLLTSGHSISLANLDQGGRIKAIKIRSPQSFSGLNKLVDIKITWDNDSQPAVYMPLADFFGYAFGEPSMQSLLSGNKDGNNYSYFPMPFDKTAKIELVYRSPMANVKAEPLQINADIYVSKEKYNPVKEGKFYACWNNNINAPAGKPHVFLEGKGKGHYVGTILQAQGLQPGMTLFFEGDDATTIDGELRLHGTGSEDYFNGGWYALLDRWDRKMSLPLHGSLDYSLPYARTGGYRLFIADKMPFEKEILHTIEHGPEQNNKPVNYTSVAIYYADKALISSQVKPSSSLKPVYVPDTLMLYPQLMKYTVSGRLTKDGDNFDSSTGGQLRIDLSDLPKGNYGMYADIEKSFSGAEVTVYQRQKIVSKPLSFYAEKRQLLLDQPVCSIILDDNKSSITFQFKSDALKSNMNIRRLIFVKQK